MKRNENAKSWKPKDQRLQETGMQVTHYKVEQSAHENSFLLSTSASLFNTGSLGPMEVRHGRGRNNL